MTRLRPARALAAALLALLLPHAAAAEPRAADLEAHILALTAPEMEGRGSGTPGGERAARYIASVLARAGLRPGGDEGTYFQEFVVGETRRVGGGSRLSPAAAESRALPLGQAWTPHGGSASGRATAELVVAASDEYAAADVRGRIVVTIAEARGDAARASRLEKLIAARRAGALGLLIVEDPLPAAGATAAPVALLSGSVTRAGMEALLAGSGRTLETLARGAERPTGDASPPGSDARAAGGAPTGVGQATAVATGVSVDLHVDLAREQRRAANVVGVLPGADPARAGEAVVIGAHYDHLGRDGATVYHGADDNASGTALVLGLAASLAAAPPPRTLVFILFAGEEMGLLGSGHHVRQPSAVPVARMAAMLNFDMVGRLGSGRLLVAGVDTGGGFRALVESAGREARIALDLHAGGAGPSDHARFYAADVPVLAFHTGHHADYHQPSDTADKLDLVGLGRIAEMAARLVARIAEGPRPLFARAASPRREARDAPSGRAAGGAFLGVAADVHAGWDGVRLGSIVPRSAAERAGLRVGDVLVRLADAGLRGFADLREQIGQRRPGETVRIVYLRDGLDHATQVTLGTRP